jgi:aminoglycoside phosphotransferase (APT) family kinase protein
MGTTTSPSSIDDAARTWLGEIAGGTVVRAERALSRREGWEVDVERSDGSHCPLFVRVARDGDPINSIDTLLKEASLATSLDAAGLRVARLVGVSEVRRLAAYERLAGRSNLGEVDAATQQTIYEHFMTLLGEVHRLDIDTAGLDGWTRPETAAAVAAAGLDDLDANYRRALTAAGSHAAYDPLAAYGLRWLRERAPQEVDRLTLVHGDAGTPNFLFEGTEVTGIIDWEWARIGDPMEDLGNATLHAIFHPSGDWPPLFEHYERSSGITVDVARVAYWRAHLAVRSVLALHTATATWDPHDPIALNLCYRIVSDRICCNCIADHDGLAAAPAALPWPPAPHTTLADAVASQLTTQVAPAIESGFAQGRAREAALLVRTIERQEAARPALDNVECDELGMLLGDRPADVASGLAALCAHIEDPSHQLDPDGEIIRYLGRRAWRAELVAEPVVSLFPALALRPLH